METHIHASFFSDWGSCGETRDGSRPVGGSGSEPEAPNPLGSPRDPEGGAGKGQKEKANAAGARPRVPDEATPRPALPPLRPGRPGPRGRPASPPAARTPGPGVPDRR